MTDSRNYLRVDRTERGDRSQMDLKILQTPDLELTNNNRSYPERVAPFTPLSDKSLIVLATEIEDLKAHIDDMNRQHVDEVDELINENRHLQDHIRKIQQEMEKSQNLSQILQDQTSRVGDLEKHIKNLEAQIGRRQQRELLLIQDNQELEQQVRKYRTECDKLKRIASQAVHSNEGPRLAETLRKLADCQRDRAALQTEVQLLVRTIQQIKQQKQGLEKDLDCLFDLRKAQ